MKELLVNGVNSKGGELFFDITETLIPARGIFYVLTYHKIEQPSLFEEQIRHLVDRYHIISVEDVMAALHNKQPLPPRSLLITFDDAYRDFAVHAWPILKHHHLPVTVFVATAFPDNPDHVFWWDRLAHAVQNTSHSTAIETSAGQFSLADSERKSTTKRIGAYLKTLPHEELIMEMHRIEEFLDVEPPPSNVLGWDELRRLSVEGVTLGAHTQTHPLLDQIPLEQAVQEIMSSLEDLQREIGEVPPILAYPAGRFTLDLVNALHETPIKLAFTTIRGANDVHNADPLRLRRNNIGEQSTVGMMRARLLQSAAFLNGFRPTDHPRET